MTNGTRWVGIDLHRRRSQIAIIDEHGELTLSKRIPTGRETITELLGDSDGTLVALEATYGWEWRAELLEDAGFDVHLAHPLRTRAIAAARVKTDAVDARTLAHLLRTGLLPEAYIAPPELRDLRDLLRHRATLVHLRTSIKNRVHALLARQGILPEHTDLFGTAGREYLTTVALPDAPRRRLDSLLALICDFDREIASTTREIDQAAKTDERVKLLCQIRGIGRYTAMLIIAEIGDVNRFPTAKHLCQWAGLTPTIRSSDGKARLGHISRQGSTILRWALTEAAQHTPTSGGPLRAQYERIAKRRGPKIAKVAVARQILTLCYYGLRDGEIRCLKHQPASDEHHDDQLAEAA
ncbi:MAG: IS110 family transposase [Solirubrobacterales bacterium]|nr:IS110 family transposase [Solirubrobacterales bacterium]